MLRTLLAIILIIISIIIFFYLCYFNNGIKKGKIVSNYNQKELFNSNVVTLCFSLGGIVLAIALLQ